MDIIVLCLCAFNSVPLNAIFIFHFYFIIMVRATKMPVGDPITLDYVKGILNVIQSRTKATRSVNDHSGTKLTKQKAECVQFREVFPSAKMSEETLKTWFKFVYEMMYDIYRTTDQSTRGGEPMPINEQIAAAVKILTYGLEMPDPRQGSFVICNFLL